jgi:tetratricopeptide (TPR) repeat protein
MILKYIPIYDKCYDYICVIEKATRVREERFKIENFVKKSYDKGLKLFKMKRYVEALEYFKTIYEYCKKDTLLEVFLKPIVEYNCGYDYRNSFDKFSFGHRQKLNINSNSSEEPIGYVINYIAECNSGMGDEYFKVKSYDKAIKCYENAYESKSNQKYNEKIADSYERLGDAFSKNIVRMQGFEYYIKAINITQDSYKKRIYIKKLEDSAKYQFAMLSLLITLSYRRNI